MNDKLPCSRREDDSSTQSPFTVRIYNKRSILRQGCRAEIAGVCALHQRQNTLYKDKRL